MSTRLIRSLPILFLLLLLTAVVVSAQTGQISDDAVNDVAKDLYCPVCESTPLDVCPTQACADWRELIRTKLAAGDSKADVHEYFALQYGDGVLANPPKRGVNLILWLFPVVAVVIGGAFFMRYLSRLRYDGHVTPEKARATREEAEAQAQLDPSDAKAEYISRIEEELQTRQA